MRTMDQALAYLVVNGKITMELARQRCHAHRSWSAWRRGQPPGAMVNG